MTRNCPRHPASFPDLRPVLDFTATAVLILGLGKGFSTSLFSVMHALLFRPLPVAEPETQRISSSKYTAVKATSPYNGPGGLALQELAAFHAG